MVAITTDSPTADRSAAGPRPDPAAVATPARVLPHGRAPRSTGAGSSASPAVALTRVVLAVAAVVLVVAVGVGTALVGRVLDEHRGIPPAAAAAEEAR